MGSKKSNKRDKKSAKKSRDSNGDLGSSSSSGIITDSRFASVHSDPRFQKAPRHKAKVEIDSRFDQIFTDPQFAGSSAPVDKRGKPKKKQESDNSLKSYYRIEEDRAKEEKEERNSDESSAESDEFDVGEDELDGLDSDTTSDEEVYCLDEDESEAPEQNVPEIEKETHRLAVVNMDWRHIKATDLYVILSSFLPKSGQIVSVAVYPSEFGLQRMKEELNGPVWVFDDKKENSDDDEDELDEEKLRTYEKSKLRYYYAVVECDSVATADFLYKACDGIEFERSSNIFDLRFIPDSMEFKHPPRDVATEAPASYEGLNFHTEALQSTKIHLSWDEDEPERARTLKRKLNTEQLESVELKEYLASDSESDDESDENEDKEEKKLKKRDIYRSLLNSGDGSDDDGEEKDNDDAQEMEVTFNTGLENLSQRILEKKSRKQETVWEAHLRENRERKKLRRNKSKDSSDDESDSGEEDVKEPGDFFVDEEPLSRPKKSKKFEGKSSRRGKQEDTNRQAEATEAELELLLADGTTVDKGVKGYNLKRKKVKGKDRKKVKETPEEDKVPPVIDDPRFSMIFTSPDFAMDPTDPQFKRSATYGRQIALRKQKHGKEFSGRDDLVPAEPHGIVEEQVMSEDRSSNKKKYELSTEIRSVKMRCQQIKVPSDLKSSLPTRDNDSLKSTKKKDKRIHDSDLSTMLHSVKKHGLSSKKKGKNFTQLKRT